MKQKRKLSRKTKTLLSIFIPVGFIFLILLGIIIGFIFKTIVIPHIEVRKQSTPEIVEEVLEKRYNTDFEYVSTLKAEIGKFAKYNFCPKDNKEIIFEAWVVAVGDMPNQPLLPDIFNVGPIYEDDFNHAISRYVSEKSGLLDGSINVIDRKISDSDYKRISDAIDWSETEHKKYNMGSIGVYVKSYYPQFNLTEEYTIPDKDNIEFQINGYYNLAEYEYKESQE